MRSATLTGFLSSLVILAGSALLLTPKTASAELFGCSPIELIGAALQMQELGICDANVDCGEEGYTFTNIIMC